MLTHRKQLLTAVAAGVLVAGLATSAKATIFEINPVTPVGSFNSGDTVVGNDFVSPGSFSSNGGNAQMSEFVQINSKTGTDVGFSLALNFDITNFNNVNQIAGNTDPENVSGNALGTWSLYGDATVTGTGNWTGKQFNSLHFTGGTVNFLSALGTCAHTPGVATGTSLADSGIPTTGGCASPTLQVGSPGGIDQGFNDGNNVIGTNSQEDLNLNSKAITTTLFADMGGLYILTLELTSGQNAKNTACGSGAPVGALCQQTSATDLGANGWGVDPIPEPASLSLLATGLLGLGAALRRRRKS